MKILFMGDSITAWWPLQEHFPGAINLGVSGHTTMQMVERFGDALAAKPEIIVILGGTNNWYPDANGVWHHLRSPAPDVLTMAIMARDAGIKVVIGLLPPHHVRDMSAYNAELRNVAEKNGFPFVDYYTPMLSGKSQNGALFGDGEHPNGAGYDVMAKALSEILQHTPAGSDR